MSAFLRLTGVAALIDAIEDAIDAARSPQEYWVGSAVEYGSYHEVGTSRMAARPHWLPAVQVVAAELGLKHDQDELVNMLVTEDRGLVLFIALRLEREVKLNIVSQHIIDTGNYLGSIAAAPSEQAAFDLSTSRRIK